MAATERQVNTLRKIALGWTKVQAYMSEHPGTKYQSASVACDKLCKKEASLLEEFRAERRNIVQQAFQMGLDSAMIILAQPNNKNWGKAFGEIAKLASGPQKLEITGVGGSPIQVESLPSEQLKLIADKLKALEDDAI